MASVKLGISLSPELAAALDDLARRRGDERSPLIETLLREHPLIRQAVARARRDVGHVNPGTRRGRDPEKLKILGQAAARAWERDLAAGRVEVHGG